jgi:hypothetical protein
MKHLQPAVACVLVLVSACSSRPAAPAKIDVTRASVAHQGFDELAPGALPSGWHAASTQPDGPVASWSVRADAAARSAPNVLSLTATNHASEDTFNLCWNAALRLGDASVAVDVRADAGEIDQGGGPAWRIQDADNYYLARFNPLESNFRVYVVENGRRKQLATAPAKASKGDWHQVEVEHVGDRITCSLDGKELLQATDSTFAEGGVGLWTKADARTSFDELRTGSLLR